MQNLYSSGLALCALFLLALGKPPPREKEGKLMGNGVHVQGLGKSGKLRIGRKQSLENDSNAMTIDFDSIQEVDGRGAPVSGQGPRRHRFNTFANQEFNITGPTNVTVYGLQATRIAFESVLSTGGELALQVFIFREEGNVTIDDEVTPVKPGTVKFNILLSNWTFCGESGGVNCRGAIGRYIDVTLRILGRKPPKRRTQPPRPPPGRGPKNHNREREFEMGGNVTISFSKKVKLFLSGKILPLIYIYISTSLTPSFRN